MQAPKLSGISPDAPSHRESAVGAAPTGAVAVPRAARGRFLRLGRGLVPVVLAFAAGIVVESTRAAATPTEASPYAATGELARVLVITEQNYVDPVDREKAVRGAISGMVASLDPHSHYLPPSDYKEFQNDTEGRFGGIGIEVDARGEEIKVLAPIEGAPAARAGIKSGDVVAAVDGESVRDSGVDKVIKKLRGAPGTKVKLTIRREGTRGFLTFELTREDIHVPSVASKRLDGNVGYIRLKQFQDKSHEEILEAAAKLRQGGTLAGLLLDLRNNPGGLVDEAAEIADEFLENGVIYSMRRRGQTIEEARAKGGGAFSQMPVVVLVNEWSASASELLTGALQDHKRALVVGAATFGKGSVQTILSLPGGAGLKITTARYFTPSGHAIQADGIHPDVLLETSTRLAADGGAPVTRERDLENHLPPEGPQGGAPAEAKSRDGGVVDGGPGAESLTVADIPKDPTTSKDLVLRTAYQLLRSKIEGR